MRIQGRTIDKGDFDNEWFEYDITVEDIPEEDGSYRGFYEYWDVKSNGMYSYIEGYLRIEDEALVDYDGCFELPAGITNALDRHGIRFNE